MDDLLKTIAPTVATALLGPLGGVAVSAIGKILGIDNATTEKVTQALSDGKLTPDHIAELKKLELQFQNDEAERGFKYSELTFKDRDSARKAAVDGGVSKGLFRLSLFLLIVCLGAEIGVLVFGYPENTPELVVGRILGLLDGVALLVLNFHYGASYSNQAKDRIIANSPPVK